MDEAAARGASVSRVKMRRARTSAERGRSSADSPAHRVGAVTARVVVFAQLCFVLGMARQLAQLGDAVRKLRLFR